MKTHKVMALIATVAVALSGWCYDPPKHTNAYTRAGVTFAQRGGMEASTYVVTNVTMNGNARMLPPYLYELDLDDTYPEDAAWYYAQADYSDGGGCSVRRNGNAVERNYDWKFDAAPTFVVRVKGSDDRFESVAVCNVGTNLTEEMVRSGTPSRFYKCLAGHATDGVNENGVFAEVNVVDGTWPRTSGKVHGLGAVRWAMDHGTNAQQVAEFLAANVYLPSGFGVNFHYLIADETETWIVEDGQAQMVGTVANVAVMTNFKLFPSITSGAGMERYYLLFDTANAITNAWFTRAYAEDTDWRSEFASVAEMETAKELWRNGSKESHRGQHVGNKWWWQSVHTSVYDLKARTLKIAVQEKDDWYVFAVPSGGKVKSVNGRTGEVVLDAAAVGAVADDADYQSVKAKATTAVQPNAIADMETKTHAAQTYQPKGEYLTEETDPTATAKANAAIAASTIISNKADKSELSGFVPYTGATRDVNLGDYYLFCDHGFYVGFGSATFTQYTYDGMLGFGIEKGISGNFLFPWAPTYGLNSSRDFALVSQIEAATNGLVSASNPAFADAVKSVAISWDISSVTNAVAALNDFKAAFGDLGAGDIVGGAGTLGGIILALIGAVTWLKKNKVQTLKLEDESIVKAAENGVAKLDDFFKDTNSLLGATIAAETAGKRDKTDLEVYEEDPETGEPTPTGETLATSGDLGGKQDSLSQQQLANIADVQNKVAKETGKGLSTNDYTTNDKQLVAGAFQKSNIAAPSSENLTDDQVLGAASAKNFINSSVQTATANFRGNFADWTAVPTDAAQYEQDAGGSRTPTTNDYMVVINAEGFGDYTANVSTGIVGRTLAVAVAGFAVGHVFVVTDIATLTAAGITQVTLKRDSTWRFKYTGSWATDGKAGWSPEYRVNEAPLTAAQLAALNSGVTSDAVQKADGALRFDAAQTLTDSQKAQIWANIGLDDFNGEEF